MKSILAMVLFFVGAAVAVPTEVEQRVAYSASLNSMAAIVMNWYGSLITMNEQVSFSETDNKWDEYRTTYPKNITQIKINSTDLTKLEALNKYQFKVTSVITNSESSELISETFIFQVDLLAKPVLESVSRYNAEQTKSAQTAKFNRAHYKAREFAYAWLAYLDGVEEMESTIYLEQWLNNARYSMKIGGKKVHGSVASTLTNRKQYLTTGGHLLHSLKVKKLDRKFNTFVLDLIVEWKGINQTGQRVLAKIHQEIEYTIQDNNSWQVNSIKEQHLLPDIAPWTGLLC